MRLLGQLLRLLGQFLAVALIVFGVVCLLAGFACTLGNLQSGPCPPPYQWQCSLETTLREMGVVGLAVGAGAVAAGSWLARKVGLV